MSNDKTLGRPVRESDDEMLFDVEPDWTADWWGMPSFEMADARPQHRITINFMSAEDVRDFAAATGLSVTPRSDSAWYPKQDNLRGDYYYDGPKTDSIYPVCIPSKGRARLQTTGRELERLGVTHWFFVEAAEYDEYCAALGSGRVVRMPFDNLGQGSIPARNFIWDWAKYRGVKRHWTVDDNIRSFYRCTNNRRLRVLGGGFFRSMESFVDRYENIAMAGPHDVGFVPDRTPGLTPLHWNSRVYSCILLDTSLPFRWRGRYNEDTDLSLRLLREGYCTLLFRALLMDKRKTVGVRNARPMAGGNTDNVYGQDNDRRRRFAESLRDQHPDVVKVTWKFDRWHHEVDYRPFRKNKPILRSGIVPHRGIDDFGMTLTRKAKQE